MLEMASTAFCASMCFFSMWIALSYWIMMNQNVMKPTIILIFIVEERQTTIFPGVPEANRRPSQENDEPIAWMDQENFGEFVFL